MARSIEKEKERNLTILGVKTKFQGIISFTDELHIAGHFDGTIEAQGALVIKKTAVCKSDHIKAATIIVEGQVQADMNAGDRIDLRTGSSIKGNLVASRLRIGDGVSFEGSVEMIRSDASFDIFLQDQNSLKEQLINENK